MPSSVPEADVGRTGSGLKCWLRATMGLANERRKYHLTHAVNLRTVSGPRCVGRGYTAGGRYKPLFPVVVAIAPLRIAN